MNAGNGNSKGLVLAGDHTNWQRMQQQATTLVKSGFLPRTIDTAEKALAVMMTGAELGLAPMASFRLIDVIQGLPTLKPMGMLALIRHSGQLAGMEVTDDGKACTVRMLRVDGSEHTERFGMDDAEKMQTSEWVNNQRRTIPLAQKANWQQQPATMRKWRAISACCRVLFSDVIMGLYTSEEVAAFAGGDFDMRDYIDGESREVVQPQVVPPDVAALAAEVSSKGRAVKVTELPPEAPAADADDPDWFDRALDEAAAEEVEQAAAGELAQDVARASTPATAKQVKMIHTLMGKVLQNGAEEKFRAWLKQTYGTDSTKDLTLAQASEVIDALKRKEEKLAAAETAAQ